MDEVTEALVAGLVDQGFSEQHALEYLKANGHPTYSGNRPPEAPVVAKWGQTTKAKDVGMDLSAVDAEILISDVSSTMGCSRDEAVSYLEEQGYTVDGFYLSDVFGDEEPEISEEPDGAYDSPTSDLETFLKAGKEIMQATSAGRQYFVRLKATLDKAMSEAEDLGALLGSLTEQGLVYSAGSQAPEVNADPAFGDYTVKKSDCVLMRATTDCGNRVQFTILPDGELRAYWVILTP